MSEAKQLARLVFTPLPVISHLTGTIKLAKLLADRDECLSITILIMKLPMEAKISSYIKNPPHSRVNFVELPQGEPVSTDSTRSPEYFVARFVESQKDLVRDAVADMINSSSSSSSKIVGFVIDMMCTSIIDVANGFGIPSYVFVTFGAAALGLMLHLQRLRDDQNVDLTGYKGSDAEISVPTHLKPVPAAVWPSSVFFKESDHLDFVKRQGFLGGDQVKEIALALESSRHRFLWSLRKPPPKEKIEFPGEYENPEEVLPQGFLERTAGIGKVIGWAPQMAVLSHPSVGGFVSHGGWNSMLESVWCGVPMAVWPLGAEQQANAFLLVKEFEMGVEIKMDYRRESDVIVGAGTIEKAIKQLMDPENEIRVKMRVAKEKSRMALTEGGSSCNYLKRFIENIHG
ncbi:UNVERIFIED_CONTAM: UDP-glycosyltransferase 71A15 [Sesamum angustifolium]|uniref:Glycosyltransferase n=1 Tax=Sesamum angustifolium TaxID=2727405 RepID=A0AAW2KM08_9LAMI